MSWRNESDYLEGVKRTKYGIEPDRQRQRVYDAERAISQGWRFFKVSDMQAWVDELVGSDWWREQRFGAVQVEVKDGRGRRSACGYLWAGAIGVVKMPRQYRTQLILCHELGHVVTPRKPHAGHGRLFAANYLALVEVQMGTRARLLLEEAFTDHSVKWWPR